MKALRLDDLWLAHDGLWRPECVLATRVGNLYVSDARGGIARIAADGGRTLFGQAEAPETARFRPNGFAMRRDGGFLFANQGEDGGVFALDRDGTIRPFLLEVEGFRLGPTNFVLLDEAERVWVSVSTRRRERHSFAKDTPDGFLVCVDARGARVAAEGFVWTNEFRFDPSGRWLYVNETMAKRLSRLAVAEDGRLGPRETLAEFGPGDFLDGMAVDAEGALWLACPVSNRVWRLTPDGERQLLLEDCEPAHLAEVERLLERGLLRGPKVHEVRSRRLPNIASLAFGGPDLKTAYLGAIGAGQVWCFKSPVAGLPMAHWEWDE